eukprot:TRINITY_DN5451_c0_g1_i2.p1 TRINITY_DN5451_c0_g1~~TRINITY_DN5451_c0_g1_i2.p1  ORF type:complete len:148 (-),score=2.18 TRINITY_DN5451_c0_g1_i2:51-458(-)
MFLLRRITVLNNYTTININRIKKNTCFISKNVSNDLNLLPKKPVWSIKKFIENKEETKEIDLNEIKQIAKLSKLEASNIDSNIQHDVQKILQCISIVKNVPTDDIEPMISPINRPIVLRPKTPRSFLDSNEEVNI